MSNLFHGVPIEMRGDILYPLNRLKDIYPDIYEKESAKYEGRTHVMEQKIPYLDCLWNDVLHFTAVSPRKLKDAFLNLGKEYNFKFYQINPSIFTEEDTVIYLYKHKTDEEKFSKDNFIKYDSEIIKDLTELPSETLEYYKNKIEAGERPLMYHRVPHILHKGTLEVQELPTISA